MALHTKTVNMTKGLDHEDPVADADLWSRSNAACDVLLNSSLNCLYG